MPLTQFVTRFRHRRDGHYRIERIVARARRYRAHGLVIHFHVNRNGSRLKVNHKRGVAQYLAREILRGNLIAVFVQPIIERIAGVRHGCNVNKRFVLVSHTGFFRYDSALYAIVGTHREREIALFEYRLNQRILRKGKRTAVHAGNDCFGCTIVPLFEFIAVCRRGCQRNRCAIAVLAAAIYQALRRVGRGRNGKFRLIEISHQIGTAYLNCVVEHLSIRNNHIAFAPLLEVITGYRRNFNLHLRVIIFQTGAAFNGNNAFTAIGYGIYLILQRHKLGTERGVAIQVLHFVGDGR